MPDDFLARTAELQRMVGNGHLIGTFMVAGGGRTIPLEVDSSITSIVGL